MDSWRFNSVPLSTTTSQQMVIHNPSSPAAGIRAPLTLLDESDFEYSVSPKTHTNSTTSSYCTSDGFLSGDGEQEQEEDDDPDEEIVQEIHFVKDYSFSRPDVKNPHGYIVQESSTITKNVLNGREVITDESSGSSVSGNAFSRPYIRSIVSSDSGECTDSDEQSVVEDDCDVKYGPSSRPLVDVTGEEVFGNEPSSVVSVGVSSVPISLRPIALISGDSDDDDDTDSQGSDVMEDYGFSGVVRVPSIDVLTRSIDSPKVKILDVGEGEEDEFDGANTAERMLVENLVQLDNAVLGEGEEQIHVEETVLTTDMSLDEGLPVFSEEATTTSLAVNANSMHIDEDMHEFHTIDDGLKHLVPVGGREQNELSEETSFNEEIASVGSAAESVCFYKKAGVMELEAAESESSGSCPDVFMEKEKAVIRGTDREDNSVDSENDCPEILEFPVCLIETKQEDDVFYQREETDASNVCQSVTIDTELDNETNIRAEDYNLLSTEVETLTLPTKSVAAEVGNEQLSVSQSGGENLQNNLEEIDDTSVSNLEGKVDANGCRDTIDSSLNQISLLEIDYSLPVSEAISPVLLAPSTPTVELEEALSEREHRKRLLHRLSSAPEGSLVGEVAEEESPSQEPTFSSAETSAVEGECDYVSSLSILVIGKTGVGKSSTINSIFGERKMVTDAFKPATAAVKEICGMIDGVKVKVLDTPGLGTSLSDQSVNRKILLSIKKHMQKSPPDVVLYMDRLDMPTSEIIDLPLIRSISTYLGSLIWHRSVIVLTHAKSLPPDGPDGAPLNHDTLVAQRLHVVRQMISRSTMDQTNIGAMVPVSLVENHSFDETNEHGESWELQLLLICHSIKIFSELDSVAVSGSSLDRVMGWISDLLWGCNQQSVFRVDADTKQQIWAELKRELSDQMPLETSSAYELELASLGLIAIANAIFYNFFS